MLYKFNINLTEEQYLEFNKYVQFYSPSGKKSFAVSQLAMTLLPVLIGFYYCVSGGFVAANIAVLITMIPISVLLFFTIKPFSWFVSKANIKSMLKKEKLYSSESYAEFYEDCMVEYTPMKQTRLEYPSIARVCVVNSNVVYLFENAVSAVIIPAAAFSSEGEWNSFLNFISSKTGRIEVCDVK